MDPNPQFSVLASDAAIAATTDALTKAGIVVITVGTAAEAGRKVRELIPEGAEVMTMTSQTLLATGIKQDIEESGRYATVRDKFAAMDPKTQGRAMRQLGAAPEWVVGSVHAVTEEGNVLIASATGSQLPAYAYGAGHVVWVVGTQKIVKNLDEGMRRIREYSFPLENERAKKVYGMGSNISKVLIVSKEYEAQRITLILVKENLGF